MKFLIPLSLILFFSAFGQQDATPFRGPQNIPTQGVIDGVVLKDEVPVRSKIEYEHVRLADYVWSKRLFSRIDAREKVNHPLFQPYDIFTEDFKPPVKRVEVVSNSNWIRNQERLSLWSIIVSHLMLGDLTMYTVSDLLDYRFTREDGYALKYPVVKTSKDAYFDGSKVSSVDITYKDVINQRLAIFLPGPEIARTYRGNKGFMFSKPSGESFSAWFNRMLADDYDPDNNPQWQSCFKEFIVDGDTLMLRNQFNLAKPGDNILMPDELYMIPSDRITAYNIKEDWFFDKERSMLDKRIIAIAPVTQFTMYPADQITSRRGSPIVKLGADMISKSATNTKQVVTSSVEVSEYEMFWLYFPELRNVMVNYYVYNNQSDAQWMSFDDFFWKRLFSAQIYKATDQFDRDIEDYRYGVDALYEAQKIKETMRTWETDLWHY